MKGDLMATAGERHNNPGCIMGKNGLKQFTTLEDGYAALNSLLYRRYNNKTCYEIFCKYAPYSDGNNPRKYADFVISELKKKGIDVSDSTVLNLKNPYVLQELTLAISKMENGKVLGGEAFARNCSVAFAYNKGLSNDAPVQLASRSSTPKDAQQVADSAQLAHLTPDSSLSPDLIESLKKNQAKAEQQLAKADTKTNKKESNSNIMKLLLQATAALLIKNSALSSAVATVIDNTMLDDKNENIALANKNDNQNA